MAITKIRNATYTCPFCGGTGKLPHFSHVQNGDCFACGATGRLRDTRAFVGDNSDLLLTVYVNNGQFSGADLRRRWLVFPRPPLQRRMGPARPHPCV